MKHIFVENSNRKELRFVKAKEMALKGNMVENKNKRNTNKSQSHKPKNPNFKKK